MTATAVTALCPIKEPGGTRHVMSPTWTVCIITDNTRHRLMVSTGAAGKDITTPPRELRWKSDQWSFKKSPYCSSSFTCWSTQTKCLKNKCLLSDWAIKISEKWIWSSFIVTTCYSSAIFHFMLLSLFCLPFFRSPNLVPLSCCFRPENIVIRSQANFFFVCKTNLPLSFCTHYKSSTSWLWQSWFDVKNEKLLHGSHLCLSSL